MSEKFPERRVKIKSWKGDYLTILNTDKNFHAVVTSQKTICFTHGHS